MNIVHLSCAVLTCAVLAAGRPSTKEHELLKRLLSLAISKKDASTISPNLTIYDVTTDDNWNLLETEVANLSTVGNMTTVKGSELVLKCATNGRVGRVASFHFMKDGEEFFQWVAPQPDVKWLGGVPIETDKVSDSGIYTCQVVTVDGVSTRVSNAIPISVVDPEPVDEADNVVIRLLEKLVETVEKKELNTKAKMQLKRSMELKKKMGAMPARKLHG